MTTTNELLKTARAARGALALAGGETRAGALRRMAARLTERTAEILAANRRDLEAARGRAPEVMLDRLRLDEGRIAAMAEGMLAVAALPERERQVILLRYFRGMTQDRTAKVLGVSQVQVSRIERKAVEHLRRKLE